MKLEEMSIKDIEKMSEQEAAENAVEKTVIKGYSVYFVDFKRYFGYSCLVFKNNHHIYYANDYQLHHSDKSVEELRKLYIAVLNNKLFTEAEISEPINSYDEYDRKSYFLNNYYAMQEDRISMFFINSGKEAEEAYKKSIEGMTFNPIGYCYMKNKDFIKRHCELKKQLEKAKNANKNDYDYQKNAFLSEMYNHEYGINMQADYDVLSVFGNIHYHGEENNELGKYFDELNFNDIQRKAYYDARREYFRKAA